MRTLAAVLMAASLAAAAEAPRVLRPAETGVGRWLPDLAFTDLAGKPGKLSEFRDSKFLVIALTNESCPLCRKFAPTLTTIEKEFSAKGVAFLFLNPTATDEPKPTFTGRYVHDAAGKLASALGATSTTDVFVLDPARTIVYRGAVDDQYGIGYAKEAPQQEYLKAALAKLLAGGVPDVPATTAPGCRLELPKPDPIAETYHNRVSRIIQQNCLECHRAGGVGPFPLETYEQVAAQAGMIRQVVDDRTMPPWFAKPEERSHFRNDRSLTEADRQSLLAWLDSGRPLGDEADSPRPRAFHGSWTIGEPDVIIQLPRPISIKATGIMPYQHVEVPTNFDEDRWVQAMEIVPTAREAVHHVLVHVIPKGAGLRQRIPGAAGRIRTDDERSGYFAAYVPGNSHTILPQGEARLLPKGASLRFQIHYTPFGTAAKDQLQLGIRFADGPPKQEAKVASVAKMRIEIPPHAENHKEVARLRVPADVTLRSLLPHMHVRGKACRYELTTPDGKTTTLLDVPRYDFNWQLRYELAEPLRVPKGSTITFTAWYDNSANNPANPDPARTVRWGQQTFDEMHLGYIEYVVDRNSAVEFESNDDEVVIPPGGVEIPDAFRNLFRPYDRNNDGKLDEKEIDALPPRLKERVLDYIRRNG